MDCRIVNGDSLLMTISMAPADTSGCLYQGQRWVEYPKTVSSKIKSTYRNIYSSKSNSLNSYLSKSKKVSDKKNYSSI